MRPRLSSLVLAAVLAAGAASAGPVSDFEVAHREMYATYRAALFQTNGGKAAESAAAISELEAQLSALSATYGAAPPPQYADDPLWTETLDAAAALVGTAAGQIGAGHLAEAHETLEGVRDLFGDLHARNGVETFSDRMNAYHAEMEHVLAMDLAQVGPEQMGPVLERAAVLDYLARDVLGAPPEEAAGDPAYAALAEAFSASVDAFLEAARSGDPERVRAAAGGLKVPYSKLFLKFG